MRPRYLPVLLLLVFLSCNRGARDYQFPEPVDTRTHEITLQEKRTYEFLEAGLQFDNQFAAARLNGVEQITDSFYHAIILPENAPINPSPWYAFRIASDRDQVVRVRLTYPTGANHRYWPKLSPDRKRWTRIDTAAIINNLPSQEPTLVLALTAGEPLYVSAQEIINTADVGEWVDGLATQPVVHREVIGQSKQGRDLLRFSIRSGELDRRPTIVLLSRQHPPEVTGFLALQGFIAGLLEDPRLDEFLQEYQVLVYPLLNPDGVDLGHWRHTSGGIDSNRDWAEYNQPEASQIANDIVRTARKAKSRVVLGMDFHSTWKDVYYTHERDLQPPSALPGFPDAWLAGIEAGIGGDFKINDSPGVIGKPTSASWFRTQFGAEGITYEIGDNTDRDFVDRKGKISAKVMIDVLLAD